MPVDHTPTDETVLRQPAAWIPQPPDHRWPPAPTEPVSAEDVAAATAALSRCIKPAAPISPQEIVAHLREAAGAPPGQQSPWEHLVWRFAADAIEALTAENAELSRLLSARSDDWADQSALRREAEAERDTLKAELTELRLQCLSHEGQAHAAYEAQKRAEAEVGRLKSRMEAACGLIERGAVRAWNDCHYRTEPLSEDRKRVIETHDMFRQAMDLLGNSEDVAHAAAKADRLWNSPMEDVIAAIRATIAESSEAEGLRPLSPEGGGYLLTRAKAGGIDMDLLGKLCREEPDEAGKRAVGEMMGKLNGGS